MAFQREAVHVHHHLVLVHRPVPRQDVCLDVLVDYVTGLEFALRLGTEPLHPELGEEDVARTVPNAGRTERSRIQFGVAVAMPVYKLLFKFCFEIDRVCFDRVTPLKMRGARRNPAVHAVYLSSSSGHST